MNPSRGNKFCPECFRPTLGLTKPSVQWYLGLFPQVAGVWGWPLTSIQCSGQEWVDLYVYVPCMISWCVQGWLYLHFSISLRILAWLPVLVSDTCVNFVDLRCSWMLALGISVMFWWGKIIQLLPTSTLNANFADRIRLLATHFARFCSTSNSTYPSNIAWLGWANCILLRKTGKKYIKKLV